MVVFALMEECADDYYGWFVSQLFASKEDAEAEMQKLSVINRGINYDVTEWSVTPKGHNDSKETKRVTS